jgi:hypothetical protein
VSNRGFARGRSAALVRALSLTVLLASPFINPASAQTIPYGGFDWFVDRSDTAPFETLPNYQGVDTVLHTGISSAVPTASYASFYQYQGRGTWTGLPVGSAFISGGLYIPQDWQSPSGSNIQNIGLWGVVGLATATPESYPIVAFYNGDGGTGAGTGLIRVWDTDHWVMLDGTGGTTNTTGLINYDAWNDLRLNYVSGNSVGSGSMQVLLNGSVIYTITGGDFTNEPIDPATASLYEIILNSRTNDFRSLSGPFPGTPYDVYWSNIQASMLVPGGTTRTFASGTYNAPLEIDPDGIAVGGTVGSPYVVTGDVNNVGGVMAGNFNVGGSFFNNGVISPGNSPGIDNIAGNYTPGVNAEFKMEVDLSAAAPVAGVDYDQINVSGNVTGLTKVSLFDVQLGPPPPTTPLSDTGPVGAIGSIDLVTIGASGGLPNFVLDQRYLRNGMDVLLDQRSGPGSTIIGLKLATPSETYDLASVPSSVITGGDVLLGTYVDRRGLDWDGKKVAWIHGVGGKTSVNDGNGVIDGQIAGVQSGLDLVALGDPSTRAGVMFGYSRQTASIMSPDGTATGTSSANSPAFGGYVTHSEGAFYADLLGQYRFLDFDLDAPMTSGMKVTGHSIDVAAEGGAKFRLSDSVTLIPFGQLVYQHVRLDDSTTGPFVASFADTDALIGRLRLLAQVATGDLVGFASAGVSDDLLSPKQTTVTGVTLASAAGGPRAEFTAGVEGRFGSGLAVFGSGEFAISFDGQSKTYLGRAGVRQEF